MVKYEKPWLSVTDQVKKLEDRGVKLGDESRAVALLEAVGYYRLTGYLYPFRESESYVDSDGRIQIRVLSRYRPGTTLEQAKAIVDFDRNLRMLVMEGVERIEVAMRMRVGYVLGRSSAFAHEDPSCFTTAFTEQVCDDAGISSSKQQEWLQRVAGRKNRSDEQFVEHFRTKYNDRMPVWALTEVLELGHLSGLYKGISQQEAEEIAQAFGVPRKKLMVSWLASLNYVRNVAAHHARLFNRKLQNAPRRPQEGEVPVLDHLRVEGSGKSGFGTYNALAVIGYLLPQIETDTGWHERLAGLLRSFPSTPVLTTESMGVPDGWESLPLWAGSWR